MPDEDLENYDITIDARRFAGVWANAVRVSHDVAEFTVDFIRLDPRQPRGMVVSRVTVTPPCFRDSIDRMEASWQTWLWRTMPPEERDD
jgi:hypothetical protein